MYFEYPYLLWLLAIPVLLVLRYLWIEIKGRRAHMRVSALDAWKAGGRSALELVRHIPFVLRIAALSLIIVAIARPRSSTTVEKVDTEGIDIMFAMDVSTSMLARDFTPDRLSAAKDIAIEFIAQRPSDRMGIVVFAGESYTQCPLTTDRATLINLMKDVQTDLIEDGTAIGNGLATAVARMKNSDAKSRVVILLTDGVNNMGEIDPNMATEIAKTYGIRVYTIGVGANGQAPYPVQTPWGIELRNIPVEIDEPLLKDIAAGTGGRYFRATDNTKLTEIFAEIDKMEKTRTSVDSFPVYKDLFSGYAIAALVCLLLEVLIGAILRRMPVC
ncbi:MAG: VWA domain-containing protein [Bacteroidales bacterium]|nr:VWA domain-containing protein [Bacteroidales bacterium]